MTAQTSKGKTVNKAEKAAVALIPKAKKSKATHFKGTDAPTACSCWNPKVSITPDARLVTCKTCLASLNPKAKKAHEKKPDVTIKCTDCKAKRIVPASQAKTVTRCLECQKKAIKAKRKAKAKIRKIRKNGDLRQMASDWLASVKVQITESDDKDKVDGILRTMATIIRETIPKAKKG